MVMQANPIVFPNRLLWNAASLGFPPTFSYSSWNRVEDGAETRRKLITQLLTVGIALLDEAPRRDGFCVELGRNISTVRQTEWGETFNVRTVPDVTSDGSKADLA